LYLLPGEWLAWRQGVGSASDSAAAVPLTVEPTTPAASEVNAAPLAAPVAPAEAASAPPPVLAASEAPVPASAPAGLLGLQASTESWVEVVDGQERTLLSRTLQPGESLALDGALPLRVKIGNAAGVRASFRGQPVDLGPATRDNVARFELK
jgi:cytoskeleton protein RodZ